MKVTTGFDAIGTLRVLLEEANIDQPFIRIEIDERRFFEISPGREENEICIRSDGWRVLGMKIEPSASNAVFISTGEEEE